MEHRQGEPSGIEQRAEQGTVTLHVIGDLGQPLRPVGRRAESELGEAEGQADALRGAPNPTHELGGRSWLRVPVIGADRVRIPAESADNSVGWQVVPEVVLVAGKG